MSVTYTYEMDMDNDGVYETDISAYVLECTIRRGRTRADERYLAGEAVLLLDNADGRFHNRNTASPYYPNLKPGRRLRVRATYNATTYNLIHALLVEIDAVARDRVQMVCQDVLGYLRDVKVSASLLENVLTGTVVAAYLDEVGIDASERNLDVGQTTIQYTTVSGSLSNVLGKVSDAEQGRIYVAKDGRVRFEDRHWRLANAQTSVWTLQDQNPIADMESPVGWETLVNRVVVVAHPVEVKTTGTLWTAQTVVSVPAGASREVWAQYSDSDTGQACVGKDLVTPVAGTDYVANSAEDGTGTDLTGQVSVTVSAFTDTAKITITNNASVTAYMTTLQLRGKPVVIGNISVREEDAASISAYRLREKRLSLELLQDVDVAKDMALFVLNMLDDPDKGPVTVVTPVDDVALPEALEVEISQRVTVNSGTHYISNMDYYVEGIEYALHGEQAETPDTLTMYLEPADMTGGWFVVGYARAGETTRLAY